MRAAESEPTRTWGLLLRDMKRACEDVDARFAVVDAWAAYIDQLEQDHAALLGATRRLLNALKLLGFRGADGDYLSAVDGYTDRPAPRHRQGDAEDWFGG